MTTHIENFLSIFKLKPMNSMDIFQTNYLWCWCCLYQTHDYAL